MKKIIFFIILALMPLSIGTEKKIVNVDDAQNNIVALISLVSYDGVSESKNFIMSLGHSFIVFKNVSEKAILINNLYILKPKGELTFSWWAISSHFGIWYNLEAYYIADFDKYDERVSLTQTVKENDLEVINDYLKNHDSYSPLNNCSKHSLELFNLIGGNKIAVPLITTPKYVTEKIKKTPGYETNIKIKISETIGFFEHDKYITYRMEKND